MKIVRFKADGHTRYGILDQDVVKGLSGTPYTGIKYSGEALSLNEVKLLAPCVPSKIVAVGINYTSHGKEFNVKVMPEVPLLFIKPSTCVIGPEDNIIYPEMSHQVDYECELGVVIGAKAKNVTTEDAPKYILGYTCFNDVTARDLQAADKQWTRAKSFDTFAPIGPWIETDFDHTKAPISTIVNGQIRQQGNTKDLIFGVIELVSFISRVMTLLPGDVIATGTPAGIGPIQKGDTVEIKIEGIGTLKNYLV